MRDEPSFEQAYSSRAVTFIPLFNTCQGTVIVTLIYSNIAKLHTYASTSGQLIIMGKLNPDRIEQVCEAEDVHIH